MTARNPTTALRRGTSRETALRPALGFRLALVAVFAAFVTMLGSDAYAALSPTPGNFDLANVLFETFFLAASGYAALRAHTTRVWVDFGTTTYEPTTLHQTRFGRHPQADLRSPTRCASTP